jgi:triacylglycerol lipase
MALDPQTSAYSLDATLACAKASLLAYDAVLTEAKVSAAFGLPVTDLVTFKGAGTDAEGFMALLNGAIAIVFRGTDSVENWIADAAVLPIPFRSMGSVHLGFHLALDSVWDVISETLNKWKGGRRTLWVTGHSLGGALALLTVANLRFPFDPATVVPKPVAGLYTFGQPRIGTRDFCRPCDADFGKLYFRFVNNEDIVPRIPPRILGYWHAGDFKFIDSQGAIQDDIAWWHGVLDAVEVGLSGFRELQATKPQIEFISDHSMTLYLEKIQAAWDKAHAIG